MRAFAGAALLLFAASACGSSGRSVQSTEALRLLNDDRFEWHTIETSNTRIHFVFGGFAQANSDSLPLRAEAARIRVLRRLEIPDYPRTLDLFYVAGRGDMEQLTGFPVTGFAYYRDDAVVVVFNENWRAFESHELTHVIAVQTWGSPAGASSAEGLAAFVDGECGGYDNGRIVSSLSEMDALLELGNLVAGFRTHDDLVAYLQAATLFEFMYQRRGADVLQSLWREGLLNAPALLGISREEFEREFREWLQSDYSPIPEAAWHEIRSEGCGIAASSAGE